MKNKSATLWVATAILAIGLLILGLLAARGPMFSSPTGLQDSEKDTAVWEAVSISKETLLLLLAVGIAGVLGLSRKTKGITKGRQRSESDDSSNS